MFYTNSKLKVSKEFASKSMIYDFYANSCLKFIWNYFYTNSKSKVYKEFASKSMIYDFYANFYLKFIWN